MKESIKMTGVVFMKYIQISDAGVHIYVAPSAKLYESTPTIGCDLFAPEKIEYTESTNRADSDKSYTGHWIEVGKTTFLEDMPKMSPQWLLFGFPLFNKTFVNVVTNADAVKYKKAKPIYKVNSADLSEEDQAKLKKQFFAKFPAYVNHLRKNFKAKVAKGEYKTLAEKIEEFKNRKALKKQSKGQNFTEDIFGRSPFEDTEPEAKKYPFTKMQVNRAKKRQVQDWCELVDIDYSNFKTLKEAKAYLNGLEGMQ